LEAAAHTDRVSALWGALTAALGVLLVLVVGHDIDHVVNEDRIGELTALFWAFLPVQYGVFLAVLFLVWRRYAQAPALAAALAAVAVVAFVGSHLVPFGPLPYAEGDPLTISWVLVFVPMAVAAVALALALRLRSVTSDD
jgi:hypothetical protein